MWQEWWRGLTAAMAGGRRSSSWQFGHVQFVRFYWFRARKTVRSCKKNALKSHEKLQFHKNNLSYDLPWTFSCDVRLAADALVVRLEATPEAAIIVDVSEDVCFAEGEPAVVWTDDPWE